MRRFLVLSGIGAACVAVATIALLVSHEPPATAGTCVNIPFTRSMHVWYGTVSGPGVDGQAIELTDNIVEDLRQAIITDPMVDQRVKDDGLASWVEAGTGPDWVGGTPDNYPAEDNLRSDLEAAAPSNGSVAFGTPNADYSNSYLLYSLQLPCTSPPYLPYSVYFFANVTYHSLDATFTSYTPSPTPSPSSTPAHTPTPTTTPTPTLMPTPTPTLTPTATPTATATPPPSSTPCPTISPTNCDVIQLPPGDADCSGDVDLDDVQAVLRDAGGIAGAPCPVSANVKCDDDLNAIDALDILEDYSGRDVSLPDGCPTIG